MDKMGWRRAMMLARSLGADHRSSAPLLVFGAGRPPILGAILLTGYLGGAIASHAA